MSGDADLTPKARKATIENAKANGFEVVESAPNLLLIDLDTIAARKQFDRTLPVLQQHYAMSDPEFTESKSGNTHAVIRLAEPQPLHVRIAMQAALGSDGVKEALALIRHEHGVQEPCLLFRPKKKGKK